MQHGLANIDASDPLTAANELDFNDRALFRGKMLKLIEEIPVRLTNASEIELTDEANPSPTDYALRQRITNLITEAKAKGQEEIPTARVYEGIITRKNYFAQMDNPVKLAWYIRPVVSHTVYYDAIHKLALKKIWAMLQSVEIDPKHLPQILKLAETAGNRMHGPVVQRIQMHQKTEMLSSSGDPREVGSPDDPALLEAKIREMQAKLQKVKPLEIEAKSIEAE